MNEVSNILKELITNISYKVTFKTIVDNTNGTYTLTTCNTLHARAKRTITINDVVYPITNVVLNESITVESDEPIVIMEGTLEVFGFHSGTLIDTDNERGSAARVDQRVTPFLWLREPFTTVLDRNRETDKYGDADVTLYFMDECDPQNMLSDNHRHEVIYPLENFALNFIKYVESRIDLFYDLTTVRVTELINVGTRGSNGNFERLFDENLSGIEMTLSLPLKNNCVNC